MGHGDAPGYEDHHKSRGGLVGPRVRPLCHAHRVHPTSHGRLIGVPPCSPTSLVGLILLQLIRMFTIILQLRNIYCDMRRNIDLTVASVINRICPQ